MQAQTVARRVEDAGLTWTQLDELAARHGLPERTIDAMFDAVLGYRVRRGGYLKRVQVTEQTATRDLAALAETGVLTALGNGRGRYYIAGAPLKLIQDDTRARRKPLHDPYPWMRTKLAAPPSLGDPSWGAFGSLRTSTSARKEAQMSTTDIQRFAESGTWVKPAGAVRVDIIVKGSVGGKALNGIVTSR
jgi:hypothetical protein